MGYAQETGYVAATVEDIMLAVMDNYNEQFGTSYTVDNFIGTSAYKYFYGLAQRLQEQEVKTSEIFLILQQYFIDTNQRISRPVVTNPGLVEKLADEGWVASVRKATALNAGTLAICVDADDGDHAIGEFVITSYANLVSGTDDSVTVGATVFTAQVGSATPGTGTFQAAVSNSATATSLAAQINAHATASTLVRAFATNATVKLRAIHGGTAGNAIALAYTDNDTNVGATKSGTVLAGGTAQADYADTKLAICTIIKDSTVAGITSAGTETESIALSNGQSFDFKYYLPAKRTITLRLTTTLSDNNQVVIKSPEEQKVVLQDNIANLYSLGKNFEPQRYFSLSDAPWASDILLEWSDDGGANYHSTVYVSEFDDLFVISIDNINLVEN